MKLIVAIIRPEKLEAVQAALNERDVYLMTVTDVRGCGRQRGYTEVYRGSEFQVRLLPKLKLEIAVNDAFVEATVEAIRDETGIDEYCLLWSIKEYKKVRLQYFTPEWAAWSAEHLRQ